MDEHRNNVGGGAQVTHSPKQTGEQAVTALRPRYSAADRSDVIHLAFVVQMTPDECQPAVAAAVVANDLMRGPWWFQIIVGLIRLRGNTASRLTFALTRLPEVAGDIIRETARHIRHGVDREEATSVGGLSQRETEIMVSILRAHTKGPSNGGEA